MLKRAFLLVPGVVLIAMAQAQMPPVTKPLPRPDAEGQKARAVAMLAPYRYDDILWGERSNRASYLCKALEAAEPPSTSGIDAWGKNVRWPFMDRQLKSGDQHSFHGDGSRLL